jgi:NAD(P)-dependent dehydrogenase (short-subunit alcohol dehydrogenase family)
MPPWTIIVMRHVEMNADPNDPDLSDAGKKWKVMSRLSGKIAVVTGASKGIGAGIARGLAAEGAAVVINYASSKGRRCRVVADIKAEGGKAIAVQGDVAKAADVEKIFAITPTSLWSAISSISALAGRVSGAGLCSPFSNFRFGGAETGSIADRERFAGRPSEPGVRRRESTASADSLADMPA